MNLAVKRRNSQIRIDTPMTFDIYTDDIR
eukprot:COSAG02_NODE_5740_length_4077_cov_12.821600_4_plen_28_part_01